MRLLIVHLKKEDDLSVVAALLLELGLFNAAVLDGEGIENIGVQQEALFSSFENLFGKGSVYNRTLVVPVPDMEVVENFLALCKHEDIDFTVPDVGWVLSFPCDVFRGPEDVEV